MNDTINVNWSKLLSRIVLYFVVALICVVILYPYFVMFLTALKSREEIFAPNGTIFPKVWMWENFVEIWKRARSWVDISCCLREAKQERRKNFLPKHRNFDRFPYLLLA